MLSKARFSKFRIFEDFTVHFGKGCYLVGPNNAGKTTVLTALRCVDIFLRYALAKKPNIAIKHNGLNLRAYPISLKDYPALTESIHHEFESSEARMEITWTNKSKLVAVWPGDEAEPYFYLIDSHG